MAIVETEAVILKSYPFGDSSKIVKCYTKDYGKISIIAKGVRKKKLLQCSYLEPFSYINLHLYRNPKRELQIFGKAEFVRLWRGLKSDIKKLSYTYAIGELIDRTITGEKEQQEIFHLLVDVLNAVNDSQTNINVFFWYFEIQLLSLLGFRPQLMQCPSCHKKLTACVFSETNGELLCDGCFFEIVPESTAINNVLQIDSSSIDSLKRLSTCKIEQLSELNGIVKNRKQVGRFLDRYYKYHFEGIKEIKSLSVMKKILT